jgi:hypothetical protein
MRRGAETERPRPLERGLEQLPRSRDPSRNRGIPRIARSQTS